MSPSTFRAADVELLQQFTRCRRLDGSTALEVGVVTWPTEHKAVLRWEPFCAWPDAPSPEELAEAWKAALLNPRYFRICSTCRARTNRGQMYDECICSRCAEKEFGIVQ